MMIYSLLKTMVQQDASDLYLTTHAHATLKISGRHQSISKEPLKPGFIRKLAYELLHKDEQEDFERKREFDKGISLDDYGRFRLNFYFQQGEVSIVARYIRSKVQSPEELKLPPVLKSLVMKKEGLLLLPAGANVLRLLPPLNVTDKEVDEALFLLNSALAGLNI